MIYVKLQHFAMRIFKKHNFLNYLFFGIIAFLALLSSVMSIVSFYVSESDISFPYQQLFFFVMFTGFYFIYYFIIPKQMYKASSLYKGTESYVFTENEIINETVSKKIHTRATFKYESICKIVEKTGILYIYVQKNQVLLVSKLGFESEEELARVRTRLKAAVPAKKYKVIK